MVQEYVPSEDSVRGVIPVVVGRRPHLLIIDERGLALITVAPNKRKLFLGAPLGLTHYFWVKDIVNLVRRGPEEVVKLLTDGDVWWKVLRFIPKEEVELVEVKRGFLGSPQIVIHAGGKKRKYDLLYSRIEGIEAEEILRNTAQALMIAGYKVKSPPT